MSRLFSQQPAAVYFPFELSWWLLFRACNIFRSKCSGETSFGGAQVLPPSPALALINGDAANSPKQSAAAAGGDRRAHQTDGPGRKNVIARKRCRRERTSESPSVKGAINYTQKGSSQSHFGLICNRQGEHSNWLFESALSVAWLLMEIDIARECDPF
jgi:hypothetical protein